MNGAPSSQDYEQVYKIYTNPNDDTVTPTNTVDFDDPLLYAAAFDNGQGGTPGRFFQSVIVDDSVPVNQDLFVTMKAAAGGGTTDGNYMIKLEKVRLDKTEATVATLKDMRGRE